MPINNSYVPSPPSRMPSVEDPRSLGISSRSGLPHRLALGSNIEGGGFFDVFNKIGKDIGKKFSIAGVNPYTAGFDLGEKVIAPALMKVIPPRGRGIKNLTGVGLVMGGQKGMRRPSGSGICC
jgi:hypothetical protein